jgi:hypothetical protein
MTIHSKPVFGKLILAAAFAGALATSAAAATDLKTTLSGGEKGDPKGGGSATVKVDTDKGEVCYKVTATGIAPATMAHIHKAPAGQNGPVAVPFAAPANNVSEGCATVTKDVAAAIVADPAGYYVNVHNAAFPGGAVRGQLSK